ncbi:MAG: hypothetical protein KatS3mg076_2076 [Candidatus Binatia bacterium]|nr:MAG: hypothetical protein KatS3mg076_2076 [Candidatus Binatia bacterium]
MARKSRPSPSGHTILVVDDQEEVLLSVRKLLEREGHRVLTAESGPIALELFHEHDIHLLLVDYFMPRMTGEQLIREIRRFDPYVQIILQTGYAGEKPARRMMAELDIQGYHDKADGPDKLLLWVDSALKAHRLLAEIRERERLQRELVANVSHEFRTPLNIILGYVDLLQEGAYGSLPESTRAPLGSIRKAVGNLTELVCDFLSYAKAEAGVVQSDPDWVETAEVARELARLGNFLLEGKDVRFTLDVTGAPSRLYTDAVKLRTILRNLVSNAAKFTAEGEVSLRIRAENGRVRFAVEDTGPGIPADKMEIVFEPFRQIDGSSTRQHGGIGLGLALSRKLARILGGDIEASSEPGRGSVFALVLPVPAGELGTPVATVECGAVASAEAVVS